MQRLLIGAVHDGEFAQAQFGRALQVLRSVCLEANDVPLSEYFWWGKVNVKKRLDPSRTRLYARIELAPLPLSITVDSEPRVVALWLASWPCR